MLTFMGLHLWLAFVTDSGALLQEVLAVTAGLQGPHTMILTCLRCASVQAALSHGQATFPILLVDHAVAAINALGGFLNKKSAEPGKLQPGLHNATAIYHGDDTYAPATANAALFVSPTCPLLFLSLP